jgi:phosphoglycolate phosphatase
VYLVLFDVDGTLIDSQYMILTAMERAFARFDLAPPSRADVLSIIGLSLDVAVTRLIGAAKVSPAAVCGAYKDAFSELRTGESRHEPLFPGAREALDRLAARDDLVLGLATGKSMRGVRSILDYHDLHGRFATLQTADGNPSKPHPGMIHAALAETGIAAERCAIVGDTGWDIGMGRAAGVVAVGVSWGYQSTAALAAAGADAIIDDFAELDPTLDRLFGRVAAGA